MKKTITFAYSDASYTIDVSRKPVGNYIIYIVDFLDEELKNRYNEFAFIQENDKNEILEDVSQDEEESKLKSIIVEKITHEKTLFKKAD